MVLWWFYGKFTIVKSTAIVTDTTAPTKPILTTTPTTTTAISQSIEVNGEVGADIYVNGIKVGTIGSDGKATISLDTSGADGDKTFSIVWSVCFAGGMALGGLVTHYFGY
ncbi:TPA: hypothetical protein EYP45_04190, partial [Candidatus Peregrinibacteria bacterium]|nr:hypothetical protein [Candidatus Peregrinibacteria bacterium]